MGIGGVQKSVRDIILEIDKNKKNWQIYLLIQYKKTRILPSGFEAKNKHTHINKSLLQKWQSWEVWAVYLALQRNNNDLMDFKRDFRATT